MLIVKLLVFVHLGLKGTMAVHYFILCIALYFKFFLNDISREETGRRGASLCGIVTEHTHSALTEHTSPGPTLNEQPLAYGVLSGGFRALHKHQLAALPVTS